MRTYLSIRRPQGFSLLEVLIAMVVLGVGLLGIAGLQLTGLRYAHNANLRYQAILQATDMIDRIRANRVAMLAGNYNNVSGIPADPACITSGCTPAQMATTDAFQWNTLNASLLPSGTGTVVAQGGNAFLVTISWSEMGAVAGVGSELKQLGVGVQL